MNKLKKQSFYKFLEEISPQLRKRLTLFQIEE